MGYYTQYHLMVVNPYNPHEIDLARQREIIATLKADNLYADHALQGDGNPNDSATWYEAIEDMRKFSLGYPNDLFVLRGEGDENPDIWIAYIWYGSVYQQQAKIVYATYAEALDAWGINRMSGEADYIPYTAKVDTSRNKTIRGLQIAGPTQEEAL